MTNVTFAWQNLFDSAVLTKSSENPLFPATNVKNRWPTRTWRSATSSGTLTEWLAFDIGAGASIQFFGLKNHNLSSSAVAHIQADDDQAFGSLDVDVTLSLASGLLAYFWSTPQTFRYWRYYVVDSAPLTTYLEAGRLWGGPIFVPALNIVNPYNKGFNDPSEIMMSDGGQILTNQKTRFRDMSMAFENIGPADVDDFEEMFMDRGLGKELFFARDQDILTTTMYCRLSSVPKLTHVLMETYYNLQLSLEELR